ncbi:acetyltransferase [Nocardia sp. 852002-20019_SCH5090214]|uniref:GNAT family N-acetyltransferase n=1 Tax=Nocardia sp. 852002-20019_SCH5090214 TaxID=1834087 RepID=UPI0007EAFF93|nr:GNAT family N-acetyltransferase [Nocardia sp. 852002-20019_SCH5090214]OBA52925.1 acetyltransferase [Nocardia sp. 852002-20019_SCH5090214]
MSSGAHPGDVILVEPMSGPADAAAFEELNLEWITALFGVEPADLATLGNPQRIVTDGGQVLIARDGDDRVGCVALVAEDPGVFEISKMAVAPRVRGRGIGRLLLNAAIDHARACGATSLFLASNGRLADAVHLYESVGFVHVPPEQLRPIPYDRADVFMKFDLAEQVSSV